MTMAKDYRDSRTLSGYVNRRLKALERETPKLRTLPHKSTVTIASAHDGEQCVVVSFADCLRADQFDEHAMMSLLLLERALKQCIAHHEAHIARTGARRCRDQVKAMLAKCSTYKGGMTMAEDGSWYIKRPEGVDELVAAFLFRMMDGCAEVGTIRVKETGRYFDVKIGVRGDCVVWRPVPATVHDEIAAAGRREAFRERLGL